MKKYDRSEYLHASARVRTLENKMLGRRELQKMMDCRGFSEAFKVLEDAGIANGLEPEQYEQGLTNSLLESYKLVQGLIPEPKIVTLLRYRYDGHNLKTIIKSRRTTGNFKDIISPLGNISGDTLIKEFEGAKFEKLSPILAAAAFEADSSLAKTADPQMVDIIIDRAVMEAMAELSGEIACPYLTDYVCASVDIANLRSAVRIKRMGKDVFFLRRVLAKGGQLDRGRIADSFAKGMDEIVSLIALGSYAKALESTFDGLRAGGGLTQFERACDNYLVSLLARAKLVSYGVEPVISYLFAKESEVRAARIVLASKAAGVANTQIAERLRDTLT